MKLIEFTDAMRAEADARLAGCDHCGDDLGIHEWIGITGHGEIVTCDRSCTPAQAAEAAQQIADVKAAEAALEEALAKGAEAEHKAAALAVQMDIWLRAPLATSTPISEASTSLVEWCRAARDLLTLMAGE